jgi:hypothetical protein
MVKHIPTQQFIGLILKNPLNICHSKCFTTQIRGISACLSKSSQVKQMTFKPKFEQQFTDLSTQLSFVTISSELRTVKRVEDFKADICSMEKKLLNSRMQSLAGGHGPYSLLDIYGVGVKAHVAGAAAYLSKCVPKEALKADYLNCSREIPVYLGENRTLMFVDPFNLILQRFATVIPCSVIMPVRWEIQGTWYCATPHMVPCTAPNRLNLTTDFHPSNWEFTLGLGSGLYSLEQIEEHNIYQRAEASRGPLIAKMANAASLNGLGGSPGLPMNSIDLSEIRDDMGNFFFPLFRIFGTWYNLVVTVLICIYFSKTATCCLWRIIAIYRVRGFGPWIILSLLDTGYIIARDTIHLILS